MGTPGGNQRSSIFQGYDGALVRLRDDGIRPGGSPDRRKRTGATTSISTPGGSRYGASSSAGTGGTAARTLTAASRSRPGARSAGTVGWCWPSSRRSSHATLPLPEPLLVALRRRRRQQRDARIHAGTLWRDCGWCSRR